MEVLVVELIKSVLQSHAPDYQYHITYAVEPMLELLWKADNSREDTRYKVLFPITTPLMARPPHHQDSKLHYGLLIDAWGGNV